MGRAVLSLLVIFAAQRAPHRATAEMEVKKLKVADIELAYVQEGQGETVVFVHGGGVGDWRSWEVLRPFISAKYRYVSLSRRYHHPNPWSRRRSEVHDGAARGRRRGFHPRSLGR